MKKIQCPFCDDCYTSYDGLSEHIEDEHIDDIPKDYTVNRYLYYLKTGKTEGKCVVCKKKTTWNDTTNKYNRFCPDPKCKEKYRKMFEKRMIGKYGKTTLLNDPNQQRKMLEHRKISGKYEWSDGTEKTYTGTYELDFLKVMDLFLGFDSGDVMTPSPHTYFYTYENEKKFYIPDAYIPSLNLEIEIKDGGNNPNMHPKIVKVDKEKERLKDEVMNSQKDIHYIKIVDKNYTNFFEYLSKCKYEYLESRNVDLNEIIKESIEFIQSINHDLVLEGVIDHSEALKNAPVIKSQDIDDTLNNAIETGHKIYVATDWHFYKYDKESMKFTTNPRTQNAVQKVKSTLKQGDVLIYLGDLVDDEFDDKSKIKSELKPIEKFTTILCRGNNDVFGDDFYYSCGFDFVTYKFIWNDILFSHMPTENDNKLNVHGHLHGIKKYWIDYTNQIDVFTEDGRPVLLDTVIKAQPKYSKMVKVKK